MSDSLKDQFNGFGDTDFKDKVHEKYSHKLANEVLFGEEMDIADINTAVRNYDHGQASEQQVTEYGVKMVFDPQKTDLDDLQENGTIRNDLKRIAANCFTCDVQYIDLTFVEEDGYTVWVIADVDSL